MREAVLQAVIEVPMSKRQARGSLAVIPGVFPDLEVGRYYLSGHSTLRGLTFLELVVELPEKTELPNVFAGFLTHMIIEAEGNARGGESEEFSLVMAEAFWLGEEHLTEVVFLDEHLQSLGIGGVDSPAADKWTSLLSSYYNPVIRPPGEVQVRKTVI